MNEWETIVAWIKEQDGIPKDSEVELIKPIQIGDKPDKRMWIDVLSEKYAEEHSDGSHPGDPDGYYDPMVRQYHLIETSLFYKLKLLVKELIELNDHESKGDPDYLPNDEWRETLWNKANSLFKRLGGA